MQFCHLRNKRKKCNIQEKLAFSAPAKWWHYFVHNSPPDDNVVGRPPGMGKINQNVILHHISAYLDEMQI